MTGELVLIAAILTLGFMVVVFTLDELKGTIRMGLAELTAAAQGIVDAGADLVTEIVTVGQSVTNEISRVEAAIAAAKSNGVDPALLDPITAQLNTAKTNLQTARDQLLSSQQALDAEQPAAVPPAPANPTPAPDQPPLT